MQDNKKRLSFEKVDCKEYSMLIKEISTLIGCDKIELEPNRMFKLSADYTTYCYFEGNLAHFTEVNDILREKLGLNPYCVGVPILIRRSDKTVIPLIPLEKFLKNCKNIIRLEGKLAEKFTYGKEINLSADMIINNNIDINKIIKSKYIYLVYDKNNIFLGFATIKNLDKKRLKIIPVRDIGWYLRKGG